MSPEKTSTSLVGQLLSAGTPNLNKVYEDDKITVLIHAIQGRLVIHADLVATKNKAFIQHYYDVMETLFEQLRQRGVKEVETWVREGTEMDFAQMYGFDEFVGELGVEGAVLAPPAFYIIKKVL